MTRPVFDPDGEFMLFAPDNYVTQALRRGEIVKSDEGHLVVVPKPINELSPEVKRRIALAKERKNK